MPAKGAERFSALRPCRIGPAAARLPRIPGDAMAPSRYLAGLIGPCMIALAGMALFNRSSLPAMLDASDGALVIIVSGAISFVAGVAILQAHRVWRGWPVIITLVGVMAVVGGLARLWAPGLVVSGARCA